MSSVFFEIFACLFRSASCRFCSSSCRTSCMLFAFRRGDGAKAFDRIAVLVYIPATTTLLATFFLLLHPKHLFFGFINKFLSTLRLAISARAGITWRFSFWKGTREVCVCSSMQKKKGIVNGYKHNTTENLSTRNARFLRKHTNDRSRHLLGGTIAHTNRHSKKACEDEVAR